MGFSVGFCFSQCKGSRERICSLSSGMNGMKRDEILSIKTTLIPLIPPFLKNFFQNFFVQKKL